MLLNGIKCLNYGTNVFGVWYEIPANAYDSIALNPQHLILTDEAGEQLFSLTNGSLMVSMTQGSSEDTVILQTYGGEYQGAPETEPTMDAVLDTLLGVTE